MYGSNVRFAKPHELHFIEERNCALNKSIIAERSDPLTRLKASLANCSSDLYNLKKFFRYNLIFNLNRK